VSDRVLEDNWSVAARLVQDAGFDPVVVGPLARGRDFEPGTPPYNTG
jgi:predicted dinucleotide-binding enzyme